MNLVRTLLLISIFQIFRVVPLTAQESMLENFSYLYMEKLVAIAKENYPKNKVFDQRVNVASNNISIAKASWLDHVSFSYVSRSNIYAMDGLNAAVLNGYFFSVSVSPGMVVKRPFNVKNAKEDLKTANAERDEYTLQLEAEVKRRYTNYLQAQNSLKLVSKRLSETDASFNYLKTRYERSEIGFKEYNDASTILIGAQEEKIAAEANYMTAKFALEELLTIKLEEIK